MEDNELAEYFNEAAEARQQEPQVSPGISAAHEHDPSGLDGTALGDAPLPTQEFNQVANDPVDRDFEAEQQPLDHAPAPALDGPTPPDSTRDAQNSITFDERQANLDASVNQDDFYDQAYDDFESGQDGFENDNLDNGMDNGGLDDGMDQD